MINHKQVNKHIESLLGEPKLYDLRCELKVVEPCLSFEEAQARYTYLPDSERHLYTITTSYPDNYCDDLNLALSAAKRIAEKNEQTFVLSLETGTWKAAFGDWGNCAEYSGSNPAYVTCISVLKFHGKL